MTCVVGEAFGYSPSGEVVMCATPADLEPFQAFMDHMIYVVDRLPTYVVVLGWLLGVVLMMLAGMAVKVLLS